MCSLFQNKEYTALSRGNHRHRRQRGQQAHELPATEVFLQNKPSQQHRNRWIQRGDYDSFVEPPALAGKYEEGAGADVEKAGQHAERN